MAESTGDGLRRAPPRGEFEWLLLAAVRARAAGVGGQLRRPNPLDELPDAIEKERWNEHEVGHGNQNRQQRCAPPRADPTKSPAPALRPGEFVDRHGAARRPPVIPGEDESLNMRTRGSALVGRFNLGIQLGASGSYTFLGFSHSPLRCSVSHPSPRTRSSPNAQTSVAMIPIPPLP